MHWVARPFLDWHFQQKPKAVAALQAPAATVQSQALRSAALVDNRTTEWEMDESNPVTTQDNWSEPVPAASFRGFPSLSLAFSLALGLTFLKRLIQSVFQGRWPFSAVLSKDVDELVLAETPFEPPGNPKADILLEKRLCS